MPTDADLNKEPNFQGFQCEKVRPMRTHIELPRFTITKLLCNAGVVGVLMLGIYANSLQAQTCVTAPSGLVGWWSGEGNALDLLGTNNGTLFGNTTFGAGEAGQAFVFDGSGDAVQLGNPVSLRLQDFTIEAWVKRGSTSKVSLTPGGGTIFGYGDNGYLLGLLDDGHVFLSQVGTSAVISSVQITDLAWHHVAVTKVGTTVVFYVDGVANPAPAFGAVFTFYNSTASIGALVGISPYNTFLGMIDELDVFNRALTVAEIQSIFNVGSAGKCPSPPV